MRSCSRNPQMVKSSSSGDTRRVVDRLLTCSVHSGSALGDTEWAEVSELFSSSYGFYSDKDPSDHAGRRIRLLPSYYRRAYASDTYQIAICREGEKLVAEVVSRACETSRGPAAFVVQLVVDERYRRRGIACNLLRKISGVADFFCLGVVTSNPLTVRALESATSRCVDLKMMMVHEALIRNEILADVDFLEMAQWRISSAESVVDSGFYTDRSSASKVTDVLSARLGTLPEGSEWLAFVFHDQPYVAVVG